MKNTKRNSLYTFYIIFLLVLIAIVFFVLPKKQALNGSDDVVDNPNSESIY